MSKRRKDSHGATACKMLSAITGFVEFKSGHVDGIEFRSKAGWASNRRSASYATATRLFNKGE